MKSLISHLRGALVSTIIFTLILCGAYPVTVWAIGQTAFKAKANGSLITESGSVKGSSLLAQNFTGENHFHPRPSAANYDAAGSGGSNLGPTSQKLADQIKERIAAYRATNGLSESTPVPADAVTASASGLDPHISPANAELQIARVAESRGLSESSVRQLVQKHTEKPTFGIFGEPAVNVLLLNLALDAAK